MLPSFAQWQADNSFLSITLIGGSLFVCVSGVCSSHADGHSPAPGDIAQQAEQRADAPGDAGGPPDALMAHAGNEHDQQRQSDAADDLHHTVDEGEEGVADAVEDAAAHVDDRQEDEEPAGEAHGACTQLDDRCFLHKQAHDGFAEELEGQHG